MIKRFYYSLVNLKYVYFMFGIPLIIFVLAFIETRKKIAGIRYVMMACTISLAIVLFFYYRDKFNVAKQLKKIKDLKAYEKGGMADRSYFLEDRMMICDGFEIQEYPTNCVETIQKEEGKFGKVILACRTQNQTFHIQTLSLQEAQRVTAFLKKKNPKVQIEGIEPAGEGTLKELGGI